MTEPLHLAASAYPTLPWKNGQGETDEIWLWPPDADRGGFSIRVSRAAITAPGAFSAFAGAERVITVIEGQGLVLDFGRDSHRLTPLAPFRFDTGQTPCGRPLGGPVRVFNVMASRRDWRMGPAVVAEAAGIPPAELLVMLALEPQTIRAGGRIVQLALHDTLICRGAGASVGGRVLAVALTAAD